MGAGRPAEGRRRAGALMAVPFREPQPGAPAFLCALDALPEGAIRGVDPFDEGRERLIVVHRAGRIRAFRNICPHYGRTPLGWKKGAFLNTARTRLVCFAHGAEFELEEGACTIGPCLGLSLATVPLRIAEGALWWCAPEDAESVAPALALGA